MPSEERSIELRPSVQRFAERMELKLRENDDKGGWEDCDTEYLMERMDEEIEELQEALDEPEEGLDVIGEAADVANFAMMLADNFGDWQPREKRVAW